MSLNLGSITFLSQIKLGQFSCSQIHCTGQLKPDNPPSERENTRFDELKNRIEKWFSIHNNEDEQAKWACHYLRKKPVARSSSQLLQATKHGIIQYLASCSNESEVDTLIKNMKNNWRIHKRRQRLTNVSIFLTDKHYRRLKELGDNKSKTHSEIISDLLDGFFDGYQQIIREERLVYEKLERELRQDHESKIKRLKLEMSLKKAKHEENLPKDYKKLVTAVKDLKMIAENIISDPPLADDFYGPIATEYIRQIDQCTKPVKKYLEPQVEAKTTSDNE